ncbi:thermonuclease family protein [Acinetobacter gandensis]|uniref:thermonuclease family protein n=1 Tax=Acinetobacter gandensis TaxID=1443941 RepID=UPI0039890B37
MNLITTSKSLILSLLIAAVSTAAQADFIGKVVRISDGDTITVLNKQNEQIRVRFNQIDAPESSQAFGQKSRQNLGYLHQTFVYVQENSKDRYGRTLGTIYQLQNGQVPKLNINNSVNLKQVKDGYAWAYREYLKDQVFIIAETNARNKKIGLWADPNPIYPSQYRRK